MRAPPDAVDYRFGVGWRAHDGGRDQPDAAGQDFGGAGSPRRGARAVYFSPYRSDDRRRDGVVCHAGRSEYRRTRSADWFCRAARDRTDDPAEVACGFPAQRVPAGAWNAGCRGSAQTAQALYRARAGFHGGVAISRQLSAKNIVFAFASPLSKSLDTLDDL